MKKINVKEFFGNKVAKTATAAFLGLSLLFNGAGLNANAMNVTRGLSNSVSGGQRSVTVTAFANSLSLTGIHVTARLTTTTGNHRTVSVAGNNVLPIPTHVPLTLTASRSTNLVFGSDHSYRLSGNSRWIDQTSLSQTW